MDDNELKKIHDALDKLEKDSDYIHKWIYYITGSIGLSGLLSVISFFI